jgi:molybdopterin-guanine dinucleotide biosynthesis protein A
VLAGGASRRMGGSPKGLEVVGKHRIIDRVAAALRDACGEVILAANDPEAASWLPGVPVVADIHPGAGGMAGVEAALQRSGTALVVAWDMPFVPARLLAEIVRLAGDTTADLVLPQSDSPYGFEPFCALYDARALPALTAFLANGGGAARDFVARIERVHRIPLRDVSAFGDPATMFLSVNTTQDLARARTIAANAG